MGNCMQNSGVGVGGDLSLPFPNFTESRLPNWMLNILERPFFAFSQGKAAVVTPLEYTPCAQKGK